MPTVSILVLPRRVTIADPRGWQKINYRRVYAHHGVTTIAESIRTTPNYIQGLCKQALCIIWCGANRLGDSGVHTLGDNSAFVKEALYRIWCGVNRLGDCGVNRLGDTSAFVNPAGQLLLTRRGKTSMDSVGMVFEFYTASL